MTKTVSINEIQAQLQGLLALAREGDEIIIEENGEPLAKWDLIRFEQLVATADEIVFTFLSGTVETQKRVRVFELVP